MKHRRIQVLVLLLVLLACSSMAQVVNIIRPTNTVWKYNSGNVDLGTEWRILAYDDSAWPQGRAPLGFDGTTGNEDVFGGLNITELNGTVIPRQTNGVTTRTHYFRHVFNWTNTATGNIQITFTNYLDDGVVMYLNGSEIYRIGLPEGAITHATAATRTDDSASRPNGDVISITANLQAGQNIFAAEVHQGGTSSSDLVFAVNANAFLPGPVSITSQPVATNIVEGQTITLRVSADDPGATFQWFANDEPIEHGTNATLTITNAGPGHAGSYLVQVSNPFRNIFSTAVPVGVAPLAITSPNPSTTNVVVVAGNLLRLPATVNGPAGFHWFFNGVEIDSFLNASANTATLLVTNVQPNESGQYTLMASNSFRQAGPATYNVTVVDDNVPPTAYALVSSNRNEVTIVFSEPVFGELSEGFNYNITPRGGGNSIQVIAVNQSGNVITLTTEEMVRDVSYELTFSSQVTDQFGNPLASSPLPLLIPDLVVPHSATWRLDLAGSAEPSGWQSPSFNDSGAPWISVVAPFYHPTKTRGTAWAPGTQLSSVTTYNASRITYYFRTHFDIPVDPAGVVLQFYHVIDDSALIYINGQEVSRVRMGNRTEGYTTQGEGSAFNPNSVSGPVTIVNAPLVQGRNTIAVSVHQIGTGSSDLDFALELYAFLPALPSEPVTIAEQPQAVIVGEGGSAEFSVTVGVASARPIHYQWYLGSQALDDATNSNLILDNLRPAQSGQISVIVSNQFGAVPSQSATLTVRPDTNAATITSTRIINLNTLEIVFSENINAGTTGFGGGNPLNYSIPGYSVASATVSSNVVRLVLNSALQPGGTVTVNVSNVADLSEAANRTTASTSAQEVPLVPFAAVWKFNNTSTDLGTAWREPAYDDSAWPSSAAPLGFENNTTTGIVVNNVPITSGTYTYYFRHNFAAIPGTYNLFFDYLVDDGFVVYLNGAEVHRYNMQPGEITIGSAAVTANPLGEGVRTNATVQNVTLQANNTLAVSLHQNSSTSTDIVFQLTVTGEEGGAIPPPQLNFTRSGSNIVFTWNDSRFHLERATSLVNPTWQDVTGSTNTGTTISNTSGNAFFRLSLND